MATEQVSVKVKGKWVKKEIKKFQNSMEISAQHTQTYETQASGTKSSQH